MGGVLEHCVLCTKHYEQCTVHNTEGQVHTAQYSEYSEDTCTPGQMDGDSDHCEGWGEIRHVKAVAYQHISLIHEFTSRKHWRQDTIWSQTETKLEVSIAQRSKNNTSFTAV